MTAPGSEDSNSVKIGVEIEPGVYPADLKEVKRWLTWKPTDDGRKVPRAPYANPGRPDLFVSAQDPELWTDFETAERWADHLPDHGVAFNIPDRKEYPEDPFVLIDYDDARDPETGAVHPVVREHLERASSYADVSTSGTGIHIFARGRLPDGVKAINAALPKVDGFPDAEIEVYDSGRYSAMTGDHLTDTPRETTDCQAFIEDLAEEYATVAEGTPDELTREPERSREEIADVEITTDLKDVFDAIQHIGPRDIRLRSTVTHKRADGSKSLDPSWASSKSGTRLAQVGDGWVYRKGMRGLDALQVVALEERIISDVNDYPSGEAFWEAVDALRARGAHIPEFEPGEEAPEPVAVLPDSDRAKAAASGWDWQHAAGAHTHDTDLSITAARDRTQTAIADALKAGDQVLIEALPTTGKSHGTVQAVAETGEPTTILTTRGHKEQYGQMREWCDAVGLSHYTLPSFARDCDTANGEHGEDWAETVRDWYQRGATPQEIHKNAEYELGEPLPCQRHEGQECPYTSKWRFDPDEYDVLIGHYAHGYKRKVTQGRAVVFDEFPAGTYETPLAGQRLAGAITYYLQVTDAVPFDDYTDLIENRRDEERRAEALAWFADQDLETDGELVFGDRQADARAPLAVFTILAGSGEELGNGWERAELCEHSIGLYDRENGVVWLLTPPALQYTRSVLALDGTPTPALWELSLGTRLNHRQVLTDVERREYLRDVLNLNLIRTTDAVKPYNSADHVSVNQDAALLDAITDQHRESPAVITTSTALDQYEANGLLELGNDGEVLDGPASATGYYGNVLGSNKFGETRLGAVIGSNHYGDGYIKRWGAYAGKAVERGEEKGTGLSYGSFGDQVLQHMREHETLQAVMRFGRDGNGATVYVHTDTLPDWVPVAGEGRVLTTWSDGMREVIDAAAELDEWRTGEIADQVSISERQVRDHLHTLQERGYLEVRHEDRGFTWLDTGLHRVNEHGEVELEPVDIDDLTEVEVAEVMRSSYYTWEFRKNGQSLVGYAVDDSISEGGAVNGGGTRLVQGGQPPG
ncbi:hypothetical protein [Halegenticoccus soli]|uniref:hypothetical protein n=1 Tax=Halegenticoccus soli TaxID=1985678 RepID=UPI000C6D29C1|nr:hypothetical protein [Halegenticoccus soli]